ncbi:MAG TPA: hypothetical protein VKD72_30390 [Gemmataceae bacterium]|nr:hypothetical protein [Gemmataceae bacterium]
MDAGANGKLARYPGVQLIMKFVTLEFTFVLNAEAAMPTSPESSRG